MDMGSDDRGSATAAFTVVMIVGLLAFALLAGWEGCEAESPHSHRFEFPRVARPVAAELQQDNLRKR